MHGAGGHACEEGGPRRLAEDGRAQRRRLRGREGTALGGPRHGGEARGRLREGASGGLTQHGHRGGAESSRSGRACVLKAVRSLIDRSMDFHDFELFILRGKSLLLIDNNNQQT